MKKFIVQINDTTFTVKGTDIKEAINTAILKWMEESDASPELQLMAINSIKAKGL